MIWIEKKKYGNVLEEIRRKPDSSIIWHSICDKNVCIDTLYFKKNEMWIKKYILDSYGNWVELTVISRTRKLLWFYNNEIKDKRYRKIEYWENKD